MTMPERPKPPKYIGENGEDFEGSAWRYSASTRDLSFDEAHNLYNADMSRYRLALLREAGKYMRHANNCDVVTKFDAGLIGSWGCTCRFDDLRQRIGEEK